MEEDLLTTNNFLYENKQHIPQTPKAIITYVNHSFIVSNKTKKPIQLPKTYERIKSLKLTNIIIPKTIPIFNRKKKGLLEWTLPPLSDEYDIQQPQEGHRSLLNYRMSAYNHTTQQVPQLSNVYNLIQKERLVQSFIGYLKTFPEEKECFFFHFKSLYEVNISIISNKNTQHLNNFLDRKGPIILEFVSLEKSKSYTFQLVSYTFIKSKSRIKYKYTLNIFPIKVYPDKIPFFKYTNGNHLCLMNLFYPIDNYIYKSIPKNRIKTIYGIYPVYENCNKIIHLSSKIKNPSILCNISSFISNTIHINGPLCSSSPIISSIGNRHTFIDFNKKVIIIPNNITIPNSNVVIIINNKHYYTFSINKLTYDIRSYYLHYTNDVLSFIMDPSSKILFANNRKIDRLFIKDVSLSFFNKKQMVRVESCGTYIMGYIIDIKTYTNGSLIHFKTSQNDIVLGTNVKIIGCTYNKSHYISPYMNIYANPIIQNNIIFPSFTQTTLPTIKNNKPNDYQNYANTFIETDNDYMDYYYTSPLLNVKEDIIKASSSSMKTNKNSFILDKISDNEEDFLTNIIKVAPKNLHITYKDNVFTMKNLKLISKYNKLYYNTSSTFLYIETSRYIPNNTPIYLISKNINNLFCVNRFKTYKLELTHNDYELYDFIRDDNRIIGQIIQKQESTIVANVFYKLKLGDGLMGHINNRKGYVIQLTEYTISNNGFYIRLNRILKENLEGIQGELYQPIDLMLTNNSTLAKEIGLEINKRSYIQTNTSIKRNTNIQRIDFNPINNHLIIKLDKINTFKIDQEVTINNSHIDSNTIDYISNVNFTMNNFYTFSNYVKRICEQNMSQSLLINDCIGLSFGQPLEIKTYKNRKEEPLSFYNQIIAKYMDANVLRLIKIKVNKLAAVKIGDRLYINKIYLGELKWYINHGEYNTLYVYLNPFISKKNDFSRLYREMDVKGVILYVNNRPTFRVIGTCTFNVNGVQFFRYGGYEYLFNLLKHKIVIEFVFDTSDIILNKGSHIVFNNDTTIHTILNGNIPVLNKQYNYALLDIDSQNFHNKNGYVFNYNPKPIKLSGSFGHKSLHIKKIGVSINTYVILEGKSGIHKGTCIRIGDQIAIVENIYSLNKSLIRDLNIQIEDTLIYNCDIIMLNRVINRVREAYIDIICSSVDIMATEDPDVFKQHLIINVGMEEMKVVEFLTKNDNILSDIVLLMGELSAIPIKKNNIWYTKINVPVFKSDGRLLELLPDQKLYNIFSDRVFIKGMKGPKIPFKGVFIGPVEDGCYPIVLMNNELYIKGQYIGYGGEVYSNYNNQYKYIINNISRKIVDVKHDVASTHIHVEAPDLFFNNKKESFYLGQKGTLQLKESRQPLQFIYEGNVNIHIKGMNYINIIDNKQKVFAIVNASNFIGGCNVLDEVKRNISELNISFTKEDGSVYKTDENYLLAFELMEEKISGF